MSEFSKEAILQKLNWRYSAKKYETSKKISDADWDFLEEVLRLSPSSYGLQPWKFFVVQNPEVRKKLMSASYGQTAVHDCSHFVVLTTLKKMEVPFVEKYMKVISDTRGVPLTSLDGFKKNIVDTWVNGPKKDQAHAWTQKQVYIAMGNLMTAAALLNIDTTPMEGLDPVKYDEILNLASSEYATVAAVACGYRHVDDFLSKVKKVRFAKEDIIERI